MKRKFKAGSCFLSLFMAATIFSGCAGNTANAPAPNPVPTDATTTDATEDGSSTATDPAIVSVNGVKIACSFPDSGANMFTILAANARALAEVTGGEVVFENTSLNADIQVSFVENQIAAGTKGIVICPAADSVLPAITKMCEEAGVYWGITFRTILDDDIREMVESSPYYVGNCFEGEENSGYMVMEHLNGLGAKQVAIISTVKGDTTGDLREKGIMRACEDFGMEVVAESRGLQQASDATKATESFLSSYPELDTVFIVGTGGAGIHEAVAKALEDSGRSDRVKLATIDYPDTMADLMESEILVVSAGLSHWGYDPFMTQIKVINAAMGTPIADGNFSTEINHTLIDSYEMAKAYQDKFGDPEALYYTDEELKQLIKAYNPDFDVAAYENTIKDFKPY